MKLRRFLDSFKFLLSFVFVEFDWKSYIKRLDNLLILILLFCIIFIFYPSCALPGNGGKEFLRYWGDPVICWMVTTLKRRTLDATSITYLFNLFIHTFFVFFICSILIIFIKASIEKAIKK
ncbi:MAG: hypothetical protein ACJ0N6_05000 [Thermodesulfobacteriota bacterium]